MEGLAGCQISLLPCLFVACSQVGVDSPGPSYSIPAALGKQQLSTKRSAGTFVMPRGQRFVDCDVREAAQKVRARIAGQDSN